MTENEKELQFEFFQEDQPLSDEEKELLETIYDRLDIFEQQNREYHDAAKKARKILHMDDPDQDTASTIEKNGKKHLN